MALLTRTSPAPARRTRTALRPPDVEADLARVEQTMRSVVGIAAEAPAGALAREHLASGGKRLRARLALSVGGALGAPPERAVPWAAACELLHNATLVHDDIQDGDRTRRGHRTVWAEHGVAQAINAGDLLLIAPYLALDRIPAGDGLRWRLARIVAARSAEVAAGQSGELALGGAVRVTMEEYRAAVGGKTGALFQLPVEGAAILAGRPEAEAASLGGAFREIGFLYQMQDDVLDLYGDKGRGATGSDIREGKISALVVEHLTLHPADRTWLGRLLALPRGETPDADVQRAMLRFRVEGALDNVLARIRATNDRILADPVLAIHPGIHALAAELAGRVLRPIEHLLPAAAAAAGNGRTAGVGTRTGTAG